MRGAAAVALIASLTDSPRAQSDACSHRHARALEGWVPCCTHDTGYGNDALPVKEREYIAWWRITLWQ